MVTEEERFLVAEEFMRENGANYLIDMNCGTHAGWAPSDVTTRRELLSTVYCINCDGVYVVPTNVEWIAAPYENKHGRDARRGWIVLRAKLISNNRSEAA